MIKDLQANLIIGFGQEQYLISRFNGHPNRTHFFADELRSTLYQPFSQIGGQLRTGIIRDHDAAPGG